MAHDNLWSPKLMTVSAARRPWLFRGLLVISGAILGLALLAVAELATRIIDPISPAERTNAAAFEYQDWSLGPCYREQGGRLLRIDPVARMGGQPPKDDRPLSAAKRPGV